MVSGTRDFLLATSYDLIIQISIMYIYIYITYIYADLTWKLMVQSGHNFAHVTTAKLSWPVQICDLIGSLESKLEPKEFSKDFSHEIINIVETGHWLHKSLSKQPIGEAQVGIKHDMKFVTLWEKVFEEKRCVSLLSIIMGRQREIVINKKFPYLFAIMIRKRKSWCMVCVSSLFLWHVCFSLVFFVAL